MDTEDKMLVASLSRLMGSPVLHPLGGGFASSRPSPVDIDDERIEPEPQQGNMEYKLKLIDPSPLRFQHLVTQMKWRLAEGSGEALYVIGVEDDGYLTGLPEEQLQASLRTLEAMAAAAGAATTLLRTRTSVRGNGKVAEVLVRRVPDDQQFIEVRVAAVGGGGVGKSTLLGVLVGGEVDNGHGRARVNLFRHRHEIDSGQTSSIGHEMLGFDSSGVVVNGVEAFGHEASTVEICERSSKVVSFYDFPGHERYIKTTLAGFSGRSIDHVALVLGANTGLCPASRGQLELVNALQLPFFIVVTKIDLCTRPVLAATLKELTQYLKGPGCKRVPVLVNNTDDVCVLGSSYHTNRMVPIFLVSSVSGKNLDLLRKFLNLLTPSVTCDEDAQCGLPSFVQINEVFNVHDVGPVVGGTVKQGVVRVGDELYLGPDDSGSFVRVIVTTIHRNRVNYHLVKAGQHASFALDGVRRVDIRCGQILTANNAQLRACHEFEADITVNYSSSAFTSRCQATVFVGTVRQTATITPLDRDVIGPGATARVRISFFCRAEHVSVGSKVLVHEQSKRAFGTVTAVCVLPPSPALSTATVVPHSPSSSLSASIFGGGEGADGSASTIVGCSGIGGGGADACASGAGAGAGVMSAGIFGDSGGGGGDVGGGGGGGVHALVDAAGSTDVGGGRKGGGRRKEGGGREGGAGAGAGVKEGEGAENASCSEGACARCPPRVASSPLSLRGGVRGGKGGGRRGRREGERGRVDVESGLLVSPSESSGEGEV